MIIFVPLEEKARAVCFLPALGGRSQPARKRALTRMPVSWHLDLRLPRLQDGEKSIAAI